MQCDLCDGQLIAIANRGYSQCADCQSYAFTTALGDPAEPIEPTGESVAVCCPKCHIALQFGVLHKRWRVCFCVNCRGFVIDSGCLGVIVHELRSHYQGPDADPVLLNQAELKKHRECPACLQPMETHPYHGPGTAVINSCAPCKVTWLDHHELDSIIRAPGFRPRRDSSPLRVNLNPNPIEIQDRSVNSAGRAIVQAITGLPF